MWPKPLPNHWVIGAVIGAGLITFMKSWLQDILPKFTSHSGQLEIVVFGANQSLRRDLVDGCLIHGFPPVGRRSPARG